MQGCFINNTAIELGQFEDLFATRLRQAIEQHQLAADRDPHQLAQVLNINLQELMVKTTANSNKAELIRAVDA